MLLPFIVGLVPTRKCDPELSALADRHYSRNKKGARDFVPPGRSLVLRDAEGTVCFAWLYAFPGFRYDNEVGYCCTIFRNESPRLSSELILEAEEWAFRKWGPNRVFTYVDPRKIKSGNPGFCFKKAGWEFRGVSKTGLHLLAKWESCSQSESISAS